MYVDIGLLDNDSFDLSKLAPKERIGINKQFTAVYNEAKRNAKLTKCFICGKECSSFCNSHTVPQFVLRNIANNGKLFYWNSILKSQLQKEFKGMKEAGVFHIICNECDNSRFQAYENQENYNGEITAKMLAQIDLKNHLKAISKKLIEKEVYTYIKNTTLELNNECEERLKVTELDMNELRNSYRIALNHVNKPRMTNYYMGCYLELPYTVPIAYQGQIAMLVDMEGNTINNTYSDKASNKMQVLNICIFPFDDKTIIMMFTERKTVKYRRFFRQIRELEDKNKILNLINYIIFLYVEDFFISPLVPKNVLDQLLPIYEKTNFGISDNGDRIEAFKYEKYKYSLIKIPDIPNLLSLEYRMKK